MKISVLSVAALLVAGAVTPAFATSISSGQTVVPTTLSSFGGTFTTLASDNNQPYSAFPVGSPADSGFVGTSVGTWSLNPFGPNALTFVTQVYVTGGDVARVTSTSFSGFQLDVEQSPLGVSTNMAMTADFNSLGVVGFNFTPPISNEVMPTQETYLLIINTNATNFTAGTISLIDGATATVNGFAPTTAAATPEPSTLSLLGTGLLTIGAGVRRRMRK